MTEVGAWRYAEHPSTTILCFSYQFGPDAPTKWWMPPMEFPAEIIAHLGTGGYIEAHNAMFEYAVWYHVLYKRQGMVMPTRWKDTMAVCAYRSIPMKLEKVGEVLNLATQKDPRGKTLIRELCQPRKPPKEPKLHHTKKGELTVASQRSLDKFHAWTKWNDDPILLNELCSYCVTDTKTEAALGKMIGELPEDEYRIWLLDMRINKRGVYLDVEGVRAAMQLMDEMGTHGERALQTLTDGKVQTGGEIKAILGFCAEHGEHLPDLQAETVEEWLEDPSLPEIVRKVLELRQLLSKASVKKLQRMLDWRCDDGRIRGMLQYHGSGTGRWAGRGPQPQNMPRGDENISGEKSAGMETLIDAIKERDLQLLEMLYGSENLAMAVSSALRGMFIAAPGMTLNVGDFSAIEARVLAWVAGEQWKLDAFAAIDRGEGYKGSPDIYMATASGVYGYPVTDKKKQKEERQTGKTCELAFGYQGGVGAWRNFDSSDKWTDAEVDEKKEAWRAAHPKTKAFWFGVEEAAVECVATGRPQHYREIGFEIVNDNAGRWFTIILPNKRRLWYYNPRLFEGKFGRMQLEYEGRDNKKAGVWNQHVATYGGMLTENIVQAISRDLMVCAMIALEKANYPVILTVHDEVICETAIDFGSEQEFKSIMESSNPIWAKGLPVSVGTFRKPRYEK